MGIFLESGYNLCSEKAPVSIVLHGESDLWPDLIIFWKSFATNFYNKDKGIAVQNVDIDMVKL